MEKIEQYKIWFQNLSFFGGTSFILDEIENLWNLTNYIGYQYSKIENKHASDYTKMTPEKSIALAQQFLDNHQIPIHIEELIQKGIIIKAEKKDTVSHFTIDGSSYLDEKGEQKIRITFHGSILDSATLIHEIMHYRNQPKRKRNFESDFLTESLSYAAELIFFEDLKGSVFEIDRRLHLNKITDLMYVFAYQTYYIYQIIFVYKRENDISKEAYDKTFADGNYEKALKEFDEYTSKKQSIMNNTWLIFGLPLAIYMLTEYQKNKGFWFSLEEFNKAMNEQSIDDCLKKIQIYSREDLINKIKSSTETFISLLKELYQTEKVGEL